MLEREQAEEEQTRLLQRIAEGSLEAMASFYDQTSAPLFSVAVQILGDRSEAEEVIQDVFVQIWEKAGTFDSQLGSAFHWSLSIARHRSIDRVRARQRRARLLAEFEGICDTEAASGTGPEESASVMEEARSVRAALKELPADQRQAIELAFFGGKTHLEIAAALREPLGTVKARIRRGLLKLRESLRA